MARFLTSLVTSLAFAVTLLDCCNLPAQGLNTSFGSVIQVPNNAALLNLQRTGTIPPTYATRQGFASAGDGGQGLYFFTQTACTLNSGSGDNGLQVPASGGGCWKLAVHGAGVDARVFGATCVTNWSRPRDSASALQSAVNDLSTAKGGGGTLIIPCPLEIASDIVITGGSLRITGQGPMYQPGMTDIGQRVVWPAVSGPAIVCPNTGPATGIPCIELNGAQAIEIDHINFGNNPTVPPTSGSWSPASYPYIIGTVNNSGWQGLNIHDVTFTATANAIDLEGTPNYMKWTGSEIFLQNIWCDPCYNTGLLIHQIDNPQFYAHLNFVPTGYYMDRASLGTYLRANTVPIFVHYAAAPQFHDVNFFATMTGFELENDTVNNGNATTLAASAMEVTNVMFNNTCQDIITANGNGTNSTNGASASIKLENVDIWGDQSGFHCTKGKKLFDLPTNQLNFSAENVNVYDSNVDSLGVFGCGVPGNGSCPSGGPAGGYDGQVGPVARFDNLNVDQYGSLTAGANLVQAPSNASVSFGASVKNNILSKLGAGALIGAGPDGTTANEAQTCIGGGPVPNAGAVCLQAGATGVNETGAAVFYDTSHVQQGFIGAANSAGIKLNTAGTIFLNPVNGANTMQIGSSGGKLILNINNLPTSCSGLATGTVVSGMTGSGSLTTCP